MTRTHRRWHRILWLIVPAAAATVLVLGFGGRTDWKHASATETEPGP